MECGYTELVLESVTMVILDKCVLPLLCYSLLIGAVLSEFTPAAYPAQIVSDQCNQHNSFHDEQLRQALQQLQIKQSLPINLLKSCKSILDNYPSACSGDYNITTANGSVVQVYCDMEGTNCGGEGGWTRVAYVNMTQDGTTCPQGLKQVSYNGSYYCGSFFYNLTGGCVSALLNTTISYQQVCGQVAGYHDRTPDAFYPYTASNTGINGVFLDGLSIMYGSPRKHIWTYTAGVGEQVQTTYGCPCNNGTATIPVPPYVGEDYYCESGTSGPICPGTLYYNDVLWDGKQCGGIEGPCCTHPNMPWFVKTLNDTTTENIELRECNQNLGCSGGVAIFLIEIYVR